MKIDFIRHGQTEYNVQGLITGQMDPALTKEGADYAEKIIGEIDTDYQDIYSSDFLRCRQTAEIINRSMRLDIKFDPRLRERNFGSLAGKKISDLDPTIIEKDTAQEYDYRPYGGESADDVRKRILSFMDEVKVTNLHNKVLVVTSGGIIRFLHHYVNGKSYKAIANGSIHTFNF